MHANPYGEDLGNRDPLEALGETPIRIRTIVERWGDDHFKQLCARQVERPPDSCHLAQTELALTTRAVREHAGFVAGRSAGRLELLDQGAEARTALDAYVVLKLNVEMWRRLSPDRARLPFNIPSTRAERQLDHVAAGGARYYHLKQIERIVVGSAFGVRPP
jgi:hypothetical protein